MSIFISNFVPISTGKSQVMYISHYPESVPSSMLSTGIMVDELPAINIPENHGISGLFINETTKELWYEYAEIPPSKVELLEKSQSEQDALLMLLLLGGA